MFVGLLVLYYTWIVGKSMLEWHWWKYRYILVYCYIVNKYYDWKTRNVKWWLNVGRVDPRVIKKIKSKEKMSRLVIKRQNKMQCWKYMDEMEVYNCREKLSQGKRVSELTKSYDAEVICNALEQEREWAEEQVQHLMYTNQYF